MEWTVRCLKMSRQTTAMCIIMSKFTTPCFFFTQHALAEGHMRERSYHHMNSATWPWFAVRVSYIVSIHHAFLHLIWQTPSALCPGCAGLTAWCGFVHQPLLAKRCPHAPRPGSWHRQARAQFHRFELLYLLAQEMVLALISNAFGMSTVRTYLG